MPRLCSRVAVIDQGRIVADASPAELAGEGTLEAAFKALTDQSEAQAA